EPVASTPEPETPTETKTASLKTGRRFGRGNRVKISEAHLAVDEDAIVDLDNLPKDQFSEEKLQETWKERVNLLFSEKPGLLSSLTKHAPKLKEDHTIELTLDGAHQLEQLQDARSTLIEAIRKDLNNFSLQLETPVKEVITLKKAYTPKEIYHGMVAENPHLEELRKQLDLDLDY
ncbi:MAG: DNA polymerase-3 subunit gamma/tau, partial [Psychroserpens sp.]